MRLRLVIGNCSLAQTRHGFIHPSRSPQNFKGPPRIEGPPTMKIFSSPPKIFNFSFQYFLIPSVPSHFWRKSKLSELWVVYQLFLRKRRKWITWQGEDQWTASEMVKKTLGTLITANQAIRPGTGRGLHVNNVNRLPYCLLSISNLPHSHKS